MAGTKAGAVKAKQALIKKYGSIKNYHAAMSEMGRVGGAKSTGGGFAHMKEHNPELHRAISTKGGRNGTKKTK